jgi:hypothetical protein
MSASRVSAELAMSDKKGPLRNGAKCDQQGRENQATGKPNRQPEGVQVSHGGRGELQKTKRPEANSDFPRRKSDSTPALK